MKEVCKIILDNPISANQMYAPSKKYRMVKTKKYTKWITNNLETIDKTKKPQKFPTLIEICVFGGKGFGKTSDIDNIAKPILDLLVKAEIIPDDNHSYVDRVNLRFMDSWSKKGNATTVITISEPED